jgi:hypothetical protein
MRKIQGYTFLEFNTTGAQPFTKGQTVVPYKGCNAIIITNSGDGEIMVNGRRLYPGVPGTSQGDAFTYGGNAGELFLGNVQVVVVNGANPQYTVEQKYYTDFD